MGALSGNNSYHGNQHSFAEALKMLFFTPAKEHIIAV